MDLESQRLRMIASIHGLEQANAEKSASLQKLEQEYNQIIERIRYKKHGSIRFDPLVKFPPEVWIPIIQQATYRISGIDHVSALATLCSCVLVSKRWHKYITETPILWSNIELSDRDNSGQDTPVLLATFLHFSQSCELSITIAIPFASWELVHDRIAMHRSRIKSIEFYPLFDYFDDIRLASYSRETNEIMRFLSPLSRLTRLEGYLDEPKWLLEEGTPLAYALTSSLSLDTLSLPASRTLQHIQTPEDIRSVIPLMRNLQLVRDIWFHGNSGDLDANIPVLQPRDIDLEGLMTLNWVSLGYYANHVHFPVWLLTRLPNLVDLRVNLWSVELIPFLSTVNHLYCLQYLSISTRWTQSPHDAPPETMLPCPSLRSLDISDGGNIYDYSVERSRGILTILVKIFSNIHSFMVHRRESGSIYMSLRSNGFQNLKDLDILDDIPSNPSPPLIEGEAWFPSSLQNLYIEHPDFILSQVQSQTIEYLNISLGDGDDIGQELSLSGWPKLQKLAINTHNVLLKNPIHQNLQEIRLTTSSDLLDSFTSFCRNVALYPSNLPSLHSISLEQLPEWDIFFLMLERKNFCSQPGVARIDRVELREVYPTRLLKPLRDLLSGLYTKRASNLDLSVVGNADIIFDPSIPGCIKCHRSLRLCEQEWEAPQGLDKLRSSLPSYPKSTEDILLTWDERAAWWRHVNHSKFGRKGSCSNVRNLGSKWILSYN